jgi:hypothetical protein
VSYLSTHRKRANAATFGLGSDVWTTNVSKAHQVAKSLRAYKAGATGLSPLRRVVANFAWNGLNERSNGGAFEPGFRPLCHAFDQRNERCNVRKNEIGLWHGWRELDIASVDPRDGQPKRLSADHVRELRLP